MKLIENTIKGSISFPTAAENAPAADLLRRILVPAPRSRYGIREITAHPWFMTKLPPGALDLNSSYLPSNSSQIVCRQSPEAIKKVIQSAVQVAGVGESVAPSTSAASEWPDSPDHHLNRPQQQKSQQRTASGPDISSTAINATRLSPGHVPYQKLMSYTVVTTSQQSPRPMPQQQQFDPYCPLEESSTMNHETVPMPQQSERLTPFPHQPALGTRGLPLPQLDIGPWEGPAAPSPGILPQTPTSTFCVSLAPIITYFLLSIT